MEINALLELEDSQAEWISRQSGPVVRRGRVVSAADLYPELTVPAHVGYARTPVPLPIVLMLYDLTVVYVPPLNRELLMQRWQASLDSVIYLADAGIVQPLVGHILEYDAPHFDPLMERNPPSVWARGLALLQALGMQETLDEASCPLPIDGMAQTRELRLRFKRRLPHRSEQDLTTRIKRELLTNYADLCIFGEKAVADALGGEPDPNLVARRLFFANEVRTYPHLFGLGGTANYDLQEMRRDPALLQLRFELRGSTTLSLLPRELSTLMRGLGVQVERLSPEAVIDFHRSGSGRELRTALSSFEREAREALSPDSEIGPDHLLEAAARFEERLIEASQLLQSGQVRKSARSIRQSLRVGIPAVGGLLAFVTGQTSLELMQALAGGAAVVGALLPKSVQDKLVGPELQDRLVRRGLERRFSPGIANLWSIMERHP